MYEVKANSKKRVRATQACVHCRKKKIKCDGARPECRHCQEANIPCEYTESKKRGPRKGYVQLLEERLAQMERRLMGPGTLLNDTMSDDDNSSTSHRAHSPIQLYENPEISSDLPPLDLVNHLVDLFFKYVNSVFPFVHRVVLKRSIKDGSVSRPLLYSVLAISARFSDHPSIRTNPPYLAGEQYANKALSLVDANVLQPNLENIQFWGIMSCLEYGRAAGSKSWIYSGLAIRFCQELGYYKEETLSVPILAEDGSIDTIAMALRRRVFWSCLCIDKLSSAGTHRPQCIDRSDVDTRPPNVQECILLRDPTYHRNVDDQVIHDDSLMNIAPHYMRCIEAFGEVTRFMNRANKASNASIVWPPIAEFRNLDMQLRAWMDNLPDRFQFNQRNLDHHREHASGNYLNIWLSSHALWSSSMMILHRGSLAFSDIKSSDVQEDLFRRIQVSIDTCRMCVDAAMGVFGAMKDLCGYNTLPYMGYSAYVFATVLMTSTFSRTMETCKKSSKGLKILFELIDGLRPYWQMCERLANATQELISVHQRLYAPPQDTISYAYEPPGAIDIKPSYPRLNSCSNNNNNKHTNSSKSHSPSALSPAGSSSSGHQSPSLISPNRLEPIHSASSAPVLSTLLGGASNPTTVYNSYKGSPTAATHPYMIPSPPASAPASLQLNQQFNNNNGTFSTAYSNWNRGNEIDFNSLEFLYDTGLFGQVVFDANSPITMNSYPPSLPLHSQPPQNNSAFEPLLSQPFSAGESTPTSFTSTRPW